MTEHIEDLVFNNGFAGAEAALEYIEQLVNMLSIGSGEKEAVVSTKWDGAPAIVCGIDPADGKFFVGTKAVFSKDAKLAKTQGQCKKLYGDRPDLHSKMSLALKVLPKLGIGGVLQGDFMFDRAAIEKAEIDGEKMIEFTPNTITYAVKEDSQLGQQMLRAKLGIIFHTAYEGAELENMNAVFGADVSSLNKTKEIWFDDAVFKDLTGVASLTPAELKRINNRIKGVEGTMSKITPSKFDVVIANKEFSKFVKPFINHMVRDGKLVGNPIEFLQGFLEFYKEKMQVEIDKIIDEKGEDNVGVKNRLSKIAKKEEFLEDHSNALLGVLAVYKRLVEIKLIVIEKLHQVEGLHTFIKDGDNYKVTNPEGFVAIGHHGGAIKLVDRLEFSKQNFNAYRSWKK